MKSTLREGCERPVLRPFNLSSNKSYKSAKRLFVMAHPEWRASKPVDLLRKREYARLNDAGTYLDYTGASLYPKSLVENHARLMKRAVFGNPHSASPSSEMSSRLASEARLAVLSFFDADPNEYTVIFTSNASNALRIVGESYPYFPDHSHLILPLDAHNSVNGLREYAFAGGAHVSYTPLFGDIAQTLAALPRLTSPNPGLFALTGQSNVSGYKYDLEILNLVKKLYGFDTLLDAAALAPTTRISLRSLGNSVDAMAISLYKMIGYPTGVGALVARSTFLTKLKKRWFSGGSVRIVQVPGIGRLLHDHHERWEDGTINFLSLSAVKPALDLLNSYSVYLPSRLALLMHFTLSYLDSLRHTNGKPIVRIHSPTPAIKAKSISGSPNSYSPQTHGAMVSFSLLNSTGDRVPPHRVEREAGKAGIHIRSGCMCNPGASAELLGVTNEVANFKLEESQSTLNNERDSPHTTIRAYSDPINENLERFIEEEGILRISFGLASTLKDAWMFIQFVKKYTKERESGAYHEDATVLASGSTACCDLTQDKYWNRGDPCCNASHMYGRSWNVSEYPTGELAPV
ncbi:pyridoxal phosphate-dependent transferase [Cantharellus anzutake]|uniref:pyridoxal phosphate-dependent transferase n=1 Tax=Cantharellus anzutake TaxID=1750568 RepID=UPI001903C944|nr:pyridoxal phosphate-dependent transferase [Cantharellus anzutake]KAF8324448.1 pyridoxal phosphate-dependent transferase [Cantharellus anzutake]